MGLFILLGREEGEKGAGIGRGWERERMMERGRRERAPGRCGGKEDAPCPHGPPILQACSHKPTLYLAKDRDVKSTLSVYRVTLVVVKEVLFTLK